MPEKSLAMLIRHPTDPPQFEADEGASTRVQIKLAKRFTALGVEVDWA
jgi:hypothetical protein